MLGKGVTSSPLFARNMCSHSSMSGLLSLYVRLRGARPVKQHSTLALKGTTLQGTW